MIFQAAWSPGASTVVQPVDVLKPTCIGHGLGDRVPQAPTRLVRTCSAFRSKGARLVRSRSNLGSLLRATFLLLAAALTACQVAGCAKPPEVPTWRPWTRVLHGHSPVPEGSRLSLTVQGETGPLLGVESLLAASIESTAAHLLTRRGFRVTNDNSGLQCRIAYQTSASEPRISTSTAHT